MFIHRRREHLVLVSAITKHTPFVCAVVDQLTTSRKSDVRRVATQLLGTGSVSLLIANESMNPFKMISSQCSLLREFVFVFVDIHVGRHKL